MNRLIVRSILVLTALSLVQAAACHAAPIVPGQTLFYGRAIQDVRILTGTPINSLPEYTLDDVYGDGYFRIDRAAQVDDSISFTGIEAYFAGSNPSLGGDFSFGAGGSVGVGSFFGTIDDIVQNPSHPGFASGDPASLTGGNMTIEVPSFYFQLLGGAVTLETGAAFTFTATIDGLPPRTPTLLDGLTPTDEIPVYFGDVLVGYSSDRRIEVAAVPEPSTFVLLGIGGLGLVGYSWRRKRQSKRLRTMTTLNYINGRKS